MGEFTVLEERGKNGESEGRDEFANGWRARKRRKAAAAAAAEVTAGNRPPQTRG